MGLELRPCDYPPFAYSIPLSYVCCSKVEFRIDIYICDNIAFSSADLKRFISTMAEVPPSDITFVFGPDAPPYVVRKAPPVAMPQPQESAPESDPESEVWERLLPECFRDIYVREDYSGNLVLDKMFAVYLACKSAQGSPKEFEFDKEFEALYFAKKKE